MPFRHVFCEDAPRGAMTGVLARKRATPNMQMRAVPCRPAGEPKEGEGRGVSTGGGARPGSFDWISAFASSGLARCLLLCLADLLIASLAVFCLLLPGEIGWIEVILTLFRQYDRVRDLAFNVVLPWPLSSTYLASVHDVHLSKKATQPPRAKGLTTAERGHPQRQRKREVVAQQQEELLASACPRYMYLTSSTLRILGNTPHTCIPEVARYRCLPYRQPILSRRTSCSYSALPAESRLRSPLVIIRRWPHGICRDTCDLRRTHVQQPMDVDARIIHKYSYKPPAVIQDTRKSDVILSWRAY
ncbi:hypothetical protein J3F83DRAFT_457965 [Trichoderma novae-zelandiae]